MESLAKVIDNMIDSVRAQRELKSSVEQNINK